MSLDEICILLSLKYLQQESITGLFFCVLFFRALYTQSLGIKHQLTYLYTVTSSIEEISWDESSRLLYDISDMLFIAACFANFVWYSNKDQNEMSPNKSQSQYP